jgi:hypothetical protein
MCVNNNLLIIVFIHVAIHHLARLDHIASGWSLRSMSASLALRKRTESHTAVLLQKKLPVRLYCVPTSLFS